MEQQERIHFIASLLPEDSASEIASTARARSEWELWEAMSCPPYVLQWFRRPEQSDSQLPAVDIDVMTLWVPGERYLTHLAEYCDAGWLLFDDPQSEDGDGSRIIIWESPRLHALRVPSPPYDLPPVPSPVYGQPAYVSPSAAPANAREEWQSTIQSGMRAGVFAAFLDGLSDGGFIDF